MRRAGRLRVSGLAWALAWAAVAPADAVEGPTAAGPIGGTDLRSGLLPPPGLYAGTAQAAAQTIDFTDGGGRPIPALQDGQLTKGVFAPFFYYVPDLRVLGGSVGFGATLPVGATCGRLFSGTASRSGLGDLYAEVDWGRFFGTLRPSKDPGAYPIPEGLSIVAGFGTVFPTGRFEPADPLSQSLSFGNNTWDFAPTRYHAGDVLNLDFAVTEHVGRFQVGAAGLYVSQIADDKLRGVRIPPDGRRGETLQMGTVLAYDMPESASSVKIKALTSVYAVNTVSAWTVTATWVRKF